MNIRLVSLLLFPLVAWTGPDSLSLEQAWKIALEANPTEDISRARLDQARARLGQARGAYQPRFDLTASGSRFEYSSRQRSRIPNGESSVEQYDAGLEARWLLWDGGTRKNRVRAAESDRRAAEAGQADSREQLLAEVGRAFTSAQLARENLAIAREDVAFQQRQLDDSERKEKAGLNSRADSLNFEIRKRAAESIAIRERARYRESMAVLEALLGLEEEETLPEPGEIYTNSPDYEVPDADAVWPKVAAELPELRESRRRVEAARLRIQSQRGQNRPDLSLFGNATFEREDDPSFTGDDLGNTIGLQVSWNLWDGGVIREQIREREAALREVEAADRQARLQARSRLRRAVANLDASLEDLDVTRNSYELSRKNRDLVEASYQAGRATLLRLNEAQRDFNNAGSRYAAARLRAQLDWIDLQRAMGILAEVVEQASTQ